MASDSIPEAPAASGRWGWLLTGGQGLSWPAHRSLVVTNQPEKLYDQSQLVHTLDLSRESSVEISAVYIPLLQQPVPATTRYNQRVLLYSVAGSLKRSMDACSLVKCVTKSDHSDKRSSVFLIYCDVFVY